MRLVQRSPGRPRRRSRARALVAAAVVTVMTAGLLTAVSMEAHAAPSLLSQGKPTTASSLESASYPASNATDGNTGTRWSSAFSDPQWLEVDLGSTASISQVVLQWETAYATGFQIQTSTDNTTWTSIFSTTTGTGGTQTLNITGTGRYVRMYGTTRATQYGYSLWEFQVYGTLSSSGGCGTTNAALNMPATASSLESASYPASAAVDGNTGTRWSSAFSDPQWLQVDLGSTQSVCGVTLIWETAYASAFQIQTSDDATNWTSIYSTTTGTGGTQNLTVSGSGRYIRMYGTTRATQWGYSLWEFQVFAGSGGSTGSPVTVTASQYSAQNSTGTEATSDTGGGQDVGWINSSSWLQYDNVDFGSGLTGNVVARIASAVSGTNIGTIQFRLDSLTATPFATVPVSGTGGWQNWVTAGPVTASPVPTGTHTLYVTFTTSTGGNFVNVNWFAFS